ncbi:MAG: ChaN family lipoprotein [Hyphomicrobiaceae bacterium]|nr:ChaN family lipoprotein [Hyphomicrobiaceae bacterium]
MVGTPDAAYCIFGQVPSRQRVPGAQRTSHHTSMELLVALTAPAVAMVRAIGSRGRRDRLERANVRLALILCGLCAGLILAAGPTRADNRTVPAPPLDWVAQGARDHVLVGKIWSARAKGFVDVQTMGLDLALARFVLLGEVHDNPDHHLWQAWGIRTISKLRGARIVEGAPQIEVIAMEMLSVEQSDSLDKFYGRNVAVPRPPGAKAFGRIVGWDKSGWPDYAIYQPIIEQALFEQIVVIPASASRAATRRVSEMGVGALGADETARLGLTAALPADLAGALAKEIADSHCGLIPERAFPAMSMVQRFRDATMADALLSVASSKGGILIAGNGHVRRDRGVPAYLVQRGVPHDQVVAVAHIEVEPGREDAAEYIPRNPAGEAAVDYVVFTPRVERPDPCEQMRAAMQKRKAAE